MSAGDQIAGDQAAPGESVYPLPTLEQMAVLIGMQRGTLSIHEARFLLDLEARELPWFRQEAYAAIGEFLRAWLAACKR